MQRYRLTIAYDGTDFCGWQKQEPPAAGGGEPPGEPAAPRRAAYGPETPLLEPTRAGRVSLRTVQGVLERAVREIVREEVELVGASRTDSGVHARGQVAAFTCHTEGRGVGWPLERGADRLASALNSRLPEDVLVVAAAGAPAGFDPVAGAVAKCYTYTFHASPRRPLWDRRYVHHVWDRRPLDVGAMADAAGRLAGEHDFAAFAAAGHGRLSTVRRIDACTVESAAAPGDEGAVRTVVRVTGNGFLWNMVRIIAGTLLQVGLGRMTAADVQAALASRDRGRAGPTAPPTGLCLEWIRYGEEAAG